MMTIIKAPLRWTRSMYDWVLRLSENKHSSTALFFLALAESSFFPIPPDALLIALCMGNHKKWVKFATVCSIGSVIGGAVGYYIGFAAFDLLGKFLLDFIASISGTSSDELLTTAQYWFNDKEIYGMKVGAWAVGIAGFTPIPYKVFTIAAGFFQMNFWIFIIASLISRSARFFVVGGIVGLTYEKYGDSIKTFIDKYFNLLAIAFVILLVLGFLVLKVI